jgi:hypothetical protein
MADISEMVCRLLFALPIPITAVAQEDALVQLLKSRSTIWQALKDFTKSTRWVTLATEARMENAPPLLEV